LELSIKAAKGESIEEPDDIEKEIAVWKKQAALNIVEAQHRNDDLIYELYTKVIKEMFEQFDNKHKHFYDMFQKVTSNTYKNGGGHAGIKWLNDEIDKIVLKPRQIFHISDEKSEEIKHDDTFQYIFINVDFKEYKYNEANPFTISSSLRFDFEPYKYLISYGYNTIEKRYDEFLDIEEQKQIIIDCIKLVFAQIKEKSGNGKL
jgi:hypothetical protein